MVRFILALIISFYFYKLYSYFYHRLPKLKYRRLELFPSVRITISGRIVHIHHWFGFLIILTVSFIFDSGILASVITKGFLTGGILQGISLPSRGIISKETND